MKKILLFVLTVHLFSTPTHASAPEESFLTNKASAVDDDAPFGYVELFGAKPIAGVRPWRAPSFEDGQFLTPKGMERQVKFWRDIYSKYSTKEGVIHDSENIDLVYEVVQFSGVERSGFLTRRQKEKAKQKLVDAAKDRASAQLKRIQGVRNGSDLSPADRKVWEYFQKFGSTSEIKEAMDKDRIRFQLGQKDRMETAIFVSGRYIEDFEDIFKAQGLPRELTRLAFVESSFNIMARSKVGASGIWQIMPYTARPYRVMNSAVDGRNDPKEATRIAAKILASNYRVLGSWPLALTGYNHEPTGVAKMVKKYKSNDLGYLVQNVTSRKSFGFASRNFYACFLAALEVERNAKKYFPHIVWSEELPAETIKLPRSIRYKDLVSWFEGNEDHAQIFNPHLTSKVRNYAFSIPAGTKVLVPKNKLNYVLANMGRLGREPAAQR